MSGGSGGGGGGVPSWWRDGEGLCSVMLSCLEILSSCAADFFEMERSLAIVSAKDAIDCSIVGGSVSRGKVRKEKTMKAPIDSLI